MRKTHMSARPARRWGILFLVVAFLSFGMAGCFIEPDHDGGWDHHDHPHFDHDHY